MKTIQVIRLTCMGLLAASLVDASYAADAPKQNAPTTSSAPAAPAVSPGAQKAVEKAKAKEAPSTAPLANATQSADPKVQEAIKKLLGGAPAEAKEKAAEKVAKQGGSPSRAGEKFGDASGSSSQGLKFTQDYYDEEDYRCYDAEDNYICDDDGNPIAPGAVAEPAQTSGPVAQIDPITKAVNDAIRGSINEAEKNLEEYKKAQATFVAAVAANNLEQVIATGPAYKDALVKASASVAAALNILLKDSAKNLLGPDTTSILNEKYAQAKSELDVALGLGQ